MKKIFIFALMVLVGVSLVFQNVKADEARTITLKAKTVTANTIVSASGATLYRVSGYANETNAIFSIRNVATLSGAVDSATVFVEGGEATQYDALIPMDFGDEGLVFNTGMTVFTSGAYVTVIYN